jgi:hypothetical protein
MNGLLQAQMLRRHSLALGRGYHRLPLLCNG